MSHTAITYDGTGRIKLSGWFTKEQLINLANVIEYGEKAEGGESYCEITVDEGSGEWSHDLDTILGPPDADVPETTDSADSYICGVDGCVREFGSRHGLRCHKGIMHS